jgi:hypothetical protein
MTDGFVAIPVAFDLVSVFVESAASITVGEYIGIMILKRFLGHEKMILLYISVLSGAKRSRRTMCDGQT